MKNVTKQLFVRRGSNSNNHRIFLGETESLSIREVMEGLTAWKDKEVLGRGRKFVGYETVNPDDAAHIVALLKSLYDYEEIDSKGFTSQLTSFGS